MFISILEGKVSQPNWAHLEKSFSDAIHHSPEGVLESFLIHSLEEPGNWRIVTIWKDKNTYDDAKASGVANTCMELFCGAGTTPHRTTYHVHQKYTRV